MTDSHNKGIPNFNPRYSPFKTIQKEPDEHLLESQGKLEYEETNGLVQPPLEITFEEAWYSTPTQNGLKEEKVNLKREVMEIIQGKISSLK